MQFFRFLSEIIFLSKFGQKKSKLSVSVEIWHLDYFDYAEFNGDAHFFRFWLELPFLDKLGPKNQNCQFKLIFGTYTNSNMQNSMTLFIFSVLDRKHSLWANLVQKIKNVSLS